MNRDEIMNILPHRGAMLLLDEALLAEDGTARGSYRIRGDEWFLDGHFPGNPVVPGVVTCEVIAQASCVLLKDQLAGRTAYYAGIDKARFRRVVRPGETLTVSAALLRSKMNLYVVKGEASVDGELCASGEFSFIIP
ncbi:3-hydroxyacyl-ACP dehydratase FabZ [Bacillota bacterium Meth-B3]|nr:3-hydroxyacyl-ACP dehydratase FabZ [Christensenellaceae bacterium]MEA5065299.1 3-hydroxyacyl-ACP dehydratase FabZ [Eubacteriales bacterium]MEA5069638.1 3-hydroxyacyl-ACP dehydratase FabZ [Christensenellaceae bacterium]